MTPTEATLIGIGVSPGVAVGPIRKVKKAVIADSVPATRAQVFEALEAVAAKIRM